MEPPSWPGLASVVAAIRSACAELIGAGTQEKTFVNDIEFILMQRKGGGYRKPDLAARILSLLSESSFRRFFRQIWTDIPGESTRDHPAPYPVALADRLIRMFSFVGDTVLDPFNGTATTQVAAAACGRDSIGIEVDPVYFADGLDRLRRESGGLLSTAHVSTGEVVTHNGLPATA